MPLSERVPARAAVAHIALVALVASAVLPATAFAQSPNEVRPAPTNPIQAGTENLQPGASTGGTTPTATSTPGTSPVTPVTPALPATPANSTAPVIPTTPVGVNSTAVNGVVAPPAPSAPLFPVVQNGLTADAAADRAVRTSHSVAGARANLQAAQLGRAEVAYQMAPQLQFSARYTRLSDYQPGAFQSFNTPGCLQNVADCQANPQHYVQSVVLQQPILDQYGLRATLTVPISDVVLRVLENFHAQSETARARSWDVQAAEEQVALAARESFYEYLRALGQVAVAEQAARAAQARRDELAHMVAAGSAMRADLLRADALLGDLRRVAVQAQNGRDLAEAQLRQRAHLGPGEPIAVGEALDGMPAVPADVDGIVHRATTERAELRSMERQLAAVDATSNSVRAAMLPSLAAVGNFDYANPNSRIFPQTQTFTATWDVSVQLAWSPSQTMVAGGTLVRMRAQREALAEQMEAMREGFEMEARAAWGAARAALAAIDSARASLASAEENLRLRTQQVRAGAAMGSTIEDAQADLLRAQLTAVNASVDLRVALARLAHASGERSGSGVASTAPAASSSGTSNISTGAGNNAGAQR